eukprot:gnl/Hemi2/18046_TR5962_c0_g1_i1.p2 gnl/Hemi2/18046_TR5962_c0_g1~~gnl/Hemi2/18046_TR5962_c0_g1_i1.p2  ORF type:complete len:152 (+),score=37.34 gnl/Hemi2/18046_TR5962_c0_g1_i1:360-815(+)
MYDDGFADITNIDFSKVVIQSLTAKHALARPGLKFLVADVLALPFPAASFDAVIEKGTMDALLVDEGSPWGPPQADVLRMCAEVARVLRPGGVYVQVTFGQPHFRKKYFDNPEYGWTVSNHLLGEGFGYYCFVLRKEGLLEPEASTPAAPS